MLFEYSDGITLVLGLTKPLACIYQLGLGRSIIWPPNELNETLRILISEMHTKTYESQTKLLPVKTDVALFITVIALNDNMTSLPWFGKLQEYSTPLGQFFSFREI